MAHTGEFVCAATEAFVSEQWEGSGRASGSREAGLPCASATKQRQARPEAEIDEEACCIAAEAGGMDSIAACAASAADSPAAGSRLVVHNAEGGGRAHMDYGIRASASAVAVGNGIDMGVPSASGLGGWDHREEYGLAS